MPPSQFKDSLYKSRKEIKTVSEKEGEQSEDVSKVLAAKREKLTEKPGGRKWQAVAKWCLLGFFLLLIGQTLLFSIHADVIVQKFFLKRSFLIMLVTGFLAQMVDGSLGMGYGTIATTFLLANGINPAIVSSRVHSARVFSSGISGYSHHRFGNINKKLFKTLVIPGSIGAVIGAGLSYFASSYANYIRIPLSIYTLYLGYYIMRKAFARTKSENKVKKAGWLASAGGFMDAFAGGGWGTLVTSTLLSKRKTPRYVIGSVCLTEFFVVLTSSVTFFILLKTIPLLEVAGLVLGGLIAAPIAAKLAGKFRMKTMLIIVGAFVILTSIHTAWKIILP